MTDEQEVFEERAAIYEFLGGFSREESEQMAHEAVQVRSDRIRAEMRAAKGAA